MEPKKKLAPTCKIPLEGAIPVSRVTFHSPVTTPKGTPESNLYAESSQPTRKAVMHLAANMTILVIFQDGKFVMVPVSNIMFFE